MEDKPGELEELRRNAESALRDPADLTGSRRLGRRTAEVQVWHWLTQDTCRSWTVYSQWKNDECSGLVRRVLWDQKSDVRRFTDPQVGMIEGYPTQPTLASVDAQVPWDEVALWIEEFRYLRFSPFIKELVEPEGLWSGLKVVSAGFEIEWPGVGPEEWLPLTVYAKRLVDRMEKLFEAKPND